MQPIQAISDNDKELIRQWCINYADAEPQSINKILSHWNKNKKKLFRGFNNQLRISFPIHEKVNSKYRQNKWRSLYSPLLVFDPYDIRYFKVDPRNHSFINSLGLWLKNNGDIQYECAKALCEYTKYCYIEDGKTRNDKIFEFRLEKPLKIPSGTKIMRAIRKVLEYYHFPHMDIFNKWRDDISVINTDKEIDAELVFSIHPIDYMTMSDNKCGWTSCMSWVDKGAYSTGTIEMMNSNMAIVVYLQHPNKFIYNGLEIPNKSWRTLVFVNQDIMIVGKHYPYQSEALAKIILDKLQIILQTNLNWTYQYKNQLYRDMIHSYDNHYIRNNFSRFTYGDSHKIYTYMNVMYADMIEDHDTEYWCCRNYVKHNKYYNLSGKATCMCCGKPIAEANKYYNDDEISTTLKYCEDCLKEYGCEQCKQLSLSDIHYIVPIEENRWYNNTETKIKVCEHCLQTEYYYDEQTNKFVHESDAGRIVPGNTTRDYFSGRQYIDANRYKRVSKERIDNLEICGTIQRVGLPN